MTKNGNNYSISHMDCVEYCKQLKDDKVHLIITSVPFANLYTYSDDPRDFSNVEDLAQFFEQMDFLIPELYRILAPGRIVAMHCKQLPTFKGRDGEMGLIDFRGDLIRAYQKHGFTYAGEKTIETDPEIEATRTKSASLLWNSYKKYAEITRTGMADYVIMMRKTERENEWVHVTHDPTDENFERWTVLANPIATTKQIRRTNVLNAEIARLDKDERHMTPLQLDLIEMYIEWYTNIGDIVFDPFGGVMSVPYQALKMGRKAIASELKQSYFETGAKYLEELEKSLERENLTLFDFND